MQFPREADIGKKAKTIEMIFLTSEVFLLTELNESKTNKQTNKRQEKTTYFSLTNCLQPQKGLRLYLSECVQTYSHKWLSASSQVSEKEFHQNITWE